LTGSCAQAQAQGGDLIVENWMEDWIKQVRAVKGALHVTRFKKPIYVLTRPIQWLPGSTAQAKYAPVFVPAGFVTDFASIPRVFWSMLRPDEEYTYPAIIHDYLYWIQDRPRAVADEILKIGMQEFGIAATTLNIIYAAVRAGGNSSWDTNAKLKAAGEKRVLKVVPEDPRASWAERRRRPDAFADS
jgi:uncharacterized protein DUF1353